jgi:hypothetical protein
MALTHRKGALRYLLLAIIPQAMSKGLEAMGDRAVAEVGQGQGAGTPYYLPALLLTLVALGLCLFALKRFFDRITKKDGSGAAPEPDRREEAEIDSVSGDAPAFDADLVIQRYLENRPVAPPTNPASARPSGFGKKGL